MWPQHPKVAINPRDDRTKPDTERTLTGQKRTPTGQKADVFAQRVRPKTAPPGTKSTPNRTNPDIFYESKDTVFKNSPKPRIYHEFGAVTGGGILKLGLPQEYLGYISEVAGHKRPW